MVGERIRPEENPAPSARQRVCSGFTTYMLTAPANREGRNSPPALALKRTGFAQLVLHAGPALTRGFLRSACTSPVGFQANGVMIAVALKRGELPNPIDCTRLHRSPGWLASIVTFGDALDVLTVAMADAIFVQEIVASGVRRFPARCGIARVPIEHEGR